MSEKNPQRELNELCRKAGIASNIFNGWVICDKDGNIYLAHTADENHAICKMLAEQSQAT